ncbi:RING finger protein 121 [Hypsibius exemplaris]|uniref:RING finger protein 121 n=1 Tax=Hypsibius exemplaris TaxID=2072580 RepID=A0A1W0WZ88_HYPEX|nr:RING finger protein 121 [Hypsibius exemplaris]
MDHAHHDHNRINDIQAAVAGNGTIPHAEKGSDHEKYHLKHKGHEQMHAEMFLILMLTLAVSHVGLVFWKKFHFRSYQTASLIGLLIVPVYICATHDWWRFVVIWFIFCVVTAAVMRKGVRRPIAVNTPRMVYKYFYGVHLISGFLSVSGYCMLLFGIFGLNFLFLLDQKTWFDIGLHLLFYGFYYGVIGRDLADIATDRMAVIVGYYSSDGVPAKQLDPRTCALCGNALLVAEGEKGVAEDTYRISCGHFFHEFCLRGWCIVGKKCVCPYCKERFNMKTVYQNPWDRPHVLLGQYLDVLRYLVAWQPLILYADQIVYNLLGLE